MKLVNPSRLVPSAARTGSIGSAVTLLFVSALTIMAATAISPGLPAIEAAFAGTEDAALLTRLLITMPALVIACVAPMAGSLTDRIGRWRVLVGAILLYGFAGMSGLVLDTLHGLLFGRVLLGAAVAGMSVGDGLVSGAALPAQYHRLFRLWFLFGFPAFGAVLLIFWLMITRPPIDLW